MNRTRNIGESAVCRPLTPTGLAKKESDCLALNRCQGQWHHFTISGLGAGGMGAQKISATGKIYNLNNLSDFSGTYQGISSGLTLIEGKMHAN